MHGLQFVMTKGIRIRMVDIFRVTSHDTSHLGQQLRARFRIDLHGLSPPDRRPFNHRYEGGGRADYTSFSLSAHPMLSLERHVGALKKAT